DWQEIRMRAVYKGCGNPSDATFTINRGAVTGFNGGPLGYHDCVDGDIRFGLFPNQITYDENEMDGIIDFSVFVGCQDCLPDGCNPPCWEINPQVFSINLAGSTNVHWIDQQAGAYNAFSCF
ncbi:MAG: hypothetical protein AAFQ98_18860, partial [Bacteroidota bacterium]